MLQQSDLLEKNRLRAWRGTEAAGIRTGNARSVMESEAVPAGSLFRAGDQRCCA